ncbi:MAG: ABC transporter ATP-binding protein [Chloroflexi bacterium]|nr:ABC transporter ATP-binding protein [Chloroflexota bacterium]MCC6893520.1 ABC transporter ATP-binding protein [Anaerolineae bacterium]
MLEVRDVYRAFGTQPVLRGIDLTIADHEIVCLLGPSGCGKTTLLRIVAGLEQPDRGAVLLDGQNIASMPTHRRGFGLMFQDFALFPHMTVAENVAFGLRMQNMGKAEQKRRVAEMLDLVGLAGFEQRDVARLSGGERQRVALARSLAPNPKLLMLDEPLGSLDAILREELLVELRHIIKQVGLTAIYVTHDQHEAFAIADRIAVMNKGRVEQFAPPLELYQHPTSEFVARFLGLDNVIPVESQADGRAQTPLGTFAVKGQAQSLLLHTDYLSLTSSSDNDVKIPAEVVQVVFQGDVYRLTLRHDSGILLTVKIPSTAPVPQGGDGVTVYVPDRAVLPLVGEG